MSKIKTVIFIVCFYLIYIMVKLTTLVFKLLRLRHLSRFRNKDIYYLEVFPMDGAGYNYRVKKWCELFQQNGYTTKAAVLIKNSPTFFKLTSPANLQYFILLSMLKRYFQILKALRYKNIIVRRSILLYNDYGNFFMEKLLYSMHNKVVLDFDDDISNYDNDFESRSLFQKIMMHQAQYFFYSFKYYQGFIVGSDYLKEHILLANYQVELKNICVIPTCVDYEKYKAKEYVDDFKNKKIVFGWIGGTHNLVLLHSIITALNKLSQKKEIELLIISGVKDYPFQQEFPIKFIQYRIENEINDLLKIDIGLMPLFDDKTSRAKCGFKLIQYMGLGIPGVASAITVNNQIVDDGENSWLVYDDDWYKVLSKIVNQLDDLQAIGIKAREKIIKNYSLNSNYKKYHEFLFHT